MNIQAELDDLQKRMRRDFAIGRWITLTSAILAGVSLLCVMITRDRGEVIRGEVLTIMELATRPKKLMGVMTFEGDSPVIRYVPAGNWDIILHGTGSEVDIKWTSGGWRLLKEEVGL